MDDHCTNLVRECQALAPSKRESRYTELYENLKGQVYNICHRITGNEATALDASQATFAIVFQRIDEFRFKAGVSSAHGSIARHDRQASIGPSLSKLVGYG